MTEQLSEEPLPSNPIAARDPVYLLAYHLSVMLEMLISFGERPPDAKAIDMAQQALEKYKRYLGAPSSATRYVKREGLKGKEHQWIGRNAYVAGFLAARRTAISSLRLKAAKRVARLLGQS